MRRIILLLSLAGLLFTACNKDDSKPGTPATLEANIDGEVIEFNNPRVILKTRDGIPQPSQIVGEIIDNETVVKNLTITFGGDLSSAIQNNDLIVLVATYYEDDYSESWGHISGPDVLDLIITQYTNQRITGSCSDFQGVNGVDTLDVTEISFTNIPIRRIDL